MRRNAPWIGVIAAVGLIGAAGLSAIQTPKYTAKVTVELAPRKEVIPQDNAGNNNDATPKDTAVDTQVEALKSPDLVEVVAANLNLANDPEFVKPDTSGRVIDAATKRQRLVETIEKKLKVRRVGQTLITEVSFTSTDPKKAAVIANAIVDAFVKKQIAQKFTDAQTSSQLINNQIDELRKKVETAQAAVQAYRASHNLLTAAGTPLTEQELSTLSQELAGVKADEAEATARLNAARQQLQRGSNGEDVGAALGSLVVADLRRQRAEVSRHVAEMQAKYGPLHPDLLSAKQQLADTDKQIKAEISRIMSNLESQVTAAHERTASIEASIAAARSDLVGSNAASVTLNQLQTNADASNALYQAVLARAKEASAQQSFEQSDVRVDAPATTPFKPSSPIWPLNLALGLVLGLAAGVGMAVVRERLEAGLSDMEEVESILGVPYIAGVPTVASSIKNGAKMNPISAVRDHPFSSFAEAFRTIDTTARHSTNNRDVKIIAVTSALPSEGKTTTSICLGEVMALAGNRVCLVDCDLRRRSVNGALGLDPTDGLMEVLAGKVSIEKALIHDKATGLTILPLARGAHLSKSPFDSAAMDEVLAVLRAQFDVVVLDTAPVLPVVDTRILAQKADTVLMLARWRKTPRNASKTAIRFLSDVGVDVFGVVLSQIDVKAQARYGKGDAAYYYKAYQGYYNE
jgi:exopolysaccharide transport family protein